MTPEEEKESTKKLVAIVPETYLNLQCPDCKKTGKGLYDVEEQEVVWVEKDTNEWEIEYQKLLTAITDYGYNDKYGYYFNWRDGADIIIKPFISQLLQQREKELVEKIEKLMPETYGQGELYESGQTDGYLTCKIDVLSLLSNNKNI